MGGFVVLMGPINCPNRTLQLAAVREIQDFEILQNFDTRKNRFFLVSKFCKISKSCISRTAASWRVLFGQLIGPISTTKPPIPGPEHEVSRKASGKTGRQRKKLRVHP